MLFRSAHARTHSQRIVRRMRRFILLSLPADPPPPRPIAFIVLTLRRWYSLKRGRIWWRDGARVACRDDGREGGGGESEKKRLEFTKWRSSSQVCDHTVHDTRIVYRDVEPPTSITICYRGHVYAWQWYYWIWRDLYADR